MGGGGASGAISWPTYLQDNHAEWLSQGTGGALLSHGNSMTEIIDREIGNSPWGAMEAAIPDDIISEWDAELSTLGALLSGINIDGWEPFFYRASEAIGTFDGINIDNFELEGIPEDAIDDLDILDMEAIDDVSVDDADGVTDAEIILDVAAFADQLDDELLTKVLPRFRRGMQDINAVVSSSFVIGAANIEGFRDRDVSKHNSELRVNAAMKNADVDVANMDKDVRIGLGNVNKDLEIAKINIAKDIDVGKTNLTTKFGILQTNLNKDIQVGLKNQDKDIKVADLNVRTLVDYKRIYLEGTDQLIKYLTQNISWNEAFTRLSIEAGRLKLVAKKEQRDMDNTLDASDALWDLEVFQYGANLLAAASGGTTPAMGGTEKPSATMTAIGGSLSGAATGAQIGVSTGGGGYGAAYGAAIGAVLGAAGSLIARNNT